MSDKNKKTGNNSTLINDLNHENQKELSKVVNKMQVVPLDPKRVKLSEINDYKIKWQDVQQKVHGQQEGTKNNDNKLETLKEAKKKNRIGIQK